MEVTEGKGVGCGAGPWIGLLRTIGPMQYGDGRPVQPIVPREIIELQRACGRIAAGVRNRLPENLWCNIEVDLSPQLARLVFHYWDESYQNKAKLMGTVELDLHPGHPIDDAKWLAGLIGSILKLIRKNDSDLIIPQLFDYIRLCNPAGQTIYEEGKAIEELRKES